MYFTKSSSIFQTAHGVLAYMPCLLAKSNGFLSKKKNVYH